MKDESVQCRCSAQDPSRSRCACKDVRRYIGPEPKIPPPPAHWRIIVRPMLGPEEGIDVTEALTRALAAEIWKHDGGNDLVNWLEAERLLGELASDRKSLEEHCEITQTEIRAICLPPLRGAAHADAQSSQMHINSK